jgi:flagellar hook-length control protein FliK
LPAAPAGQEIEGAVLRHAAHLKLDAGPLGSIELHLRVREGALHLRLDGEAAHALEARAGELSRSLAGEGLRLAPIEVSRQDGSTSTDGGSGFRQGQEQREAWNEAADSRETAWHAPRRDRSARPAAESSSAESSRAVLGGVHVKA